MTDLKNIRSILVIKMRNIGDVLLATPLFGNLRIHFPDARICALVNSGTEEMLIHNPDIDRIYLYDRTAKKKPWMQRYGIELRLLSDIRKEKFDLVLNLTEGDRGALAALFSGARVRIGIDALGRGFMGKNLVFDKVLSPPQSDMHTVDMDLRMLETIGRPIVSKKVSFYFNNRDLESAGSRLASAGLEPGNYFLVHCTSRWMFKAMPPAKAARFLEMLAARSGLPCLLTSSPERKELDYLVELQRHCRLPKVPVFSDLSLKELGALISTAHFFAGVDSAPMHMAAALDIPVLAVFGPSAVPAWGPWDNSSCTSPYIAERGIQNSGKHFVLQSGKSCVPCHRDGCNGSKVSDCLDFSVEEIDSVIADFLKRIALNEVKNQSPQVSSKGQI